MIWLRNHAFLGTEYDWVACDSGGRVGYFSTAGFGGIPGSVGAIGDKMYGICDLVADLAEIGSARVISDRPNRDDWIRPASRGFFAYDWSHERDCYEPVAVPSRPLLLAELALQSPIRAAAEASRLNDDFDGEGDIPMR